MNIEEAESYIKNLLSPSDFISIGNTGVGMCMCVVNNYISNEGWSVFYSERGQRDDIELFENENDACHRFIERSIDLFENRLKLFKNILKKIP